MYLVYIGLALLAVFALLPIIVNCLPAQRGSG